MPAALKLMLLADLLENMPQSRCLKLDFLIALLADKVLMLRVAVIVFVEHARPEIESAQQARVHQLAERAVNGRPFRLEPSPFHVIDELIGVEVVVLAEDIANHIALLVSVALRARPAGKIFAKLVFRALRHCDRWQMHGSSPGCLTCVYQNYLTIVAGRGSAVGRFWFYRLRRSD